MKNGLSSLFGLLFALSDDLISLSFHLRVALLSALPFYFEFRDERDLIVVHEQSLLSEPHRS